MWVPLRATIQRSDFHDLDGRLRIEKRFQVKPQMIQALTHNVGTLFCLGENECPL
jgi:hypothetical protein